METVLVDLFVVPKESMTAFVEQAREAQRFVRSQPGFIEGYLYEKKAGDNRYNVLTMAVWKNQAAVENAKQAVADEFRKRGVDRQEFIKKLNIEMIRSVYDRHPY